MIEHITQLLLIWGAWVREHRGGYARLGYPGDSAGRIRRTAAADDTLSRTRDWVCADCQARHIRVSKPKECSVCGHHQLYQNENFCHGREKRKTQSRVERIDDNPVAEAIDRALATIPDYLRSLRRVALQKYVFEYTDARGAKNLNMSEARYKACAVQLHAWLDGYLQTHAEIERLTAVNG